MEKDEYRKHFELEESHWWFRGRRAILLRLLEAQARPVKPWTWLDAGCGTGFNMTVFARFGPVFGCDYAPEALAFCRRRGLVNLARADVQSLPFKSVAFDAASLLDVLYHKAISDDVAVLREVRRTLKPGGLLLVSDSALNILRGRHDEAVHGRARYNKKELRAKLETAGFEILRMSYFNFFLFPAVYGLRLSERLRARRSAQNAPVRSDLRPVSRLPNAGLAGILKLEAFLLKNIGFPWGSSIAICARRI